MRASRDAPGLLLLGLLCLTACGCTRRATQLLVVDAKDLDGEFQSITGPPPPSAA